MQGRDGKITAIAHESWSGDLPGGGPEVAVQRLRLLYAGANRMTAMRLATLDLPEGNAMRAPGEAPGMMALEIAIDEMAERLGLDPVEFRIINDTQVDPENPNGPSRIAIFVGCLRTGAERFGWQGRNKQPGARREGNWLIGMGVAAAFRNNLVLNSGAASGSTARASYGQTDMTISYGQLHDHRPEALKCLVCRSRRSPSAWETHAPVSSGSRAVRRKLLHGRRYAACAQAAGTRGAEARLQTARRPCLRRRAKSGRRPAECRSRKLRAMRARR